ncbi:MAG: hypothetical protein O2838_01890 [Proteobacteria bacterium]|nr:hypothetical protein [Pseudomonadota bacterium]
MSNPESFIDEVTEELRRDRLYGTFRKYGWIGGLLVALTVGGAAVHEYRKSAATQKAQSFGDALLDALETPVGPARTAALSAIAAQTSQEPLLALLRSADMEADLTTRAASLRSLADNEAAPQAYRDLAVLRLALISDADVSAREALLSPLATPGRALRPLALEQLAYLKVEANDLTGALSDLNDLSVDQQAPAQLRQRVKQMIIVLGGQVAAG